MKPSLPSSPSSPSSRNAPRRLVCRLMRWIDAWQGDDTAPRGRVYRHGENCAACAAYFARSHGLEQRLQEESRATAPGEIPAGLEDRIWAAVRPEIDARREPVNSKGWADWRPLGMGAIAAALVLAVWWGGRDSGGGEGTPDGAMAAADRLEFNEADMRELVATVEQFSTEWLAVSARESEHALQASVLDQELQALGSDARGAWRFLEQNFLPRAVQPRDGQI